MSEEIRKYEEIYRDAYGSYGHSNHGQGAVSIVADVLHAASVLDVGCGHNEFVRGLRKTHRTIRGMGVDFACKSADLRARATSLPFFDNVFDVVTSFDCLEHLLPHEVDAALAEFRRVSRAFVFSIAYRPSVTRWRGQTLHPTVREQQWWLTRIAEAGGIEIRLDGRYIFGRWDGRAMPARTPLPMSSAPCPVAPGASCVLVGNGPSVLDAKLGEAIDAHDEVVRFNCFATLGLEDHSGSKVTLWCNFGGGTLPQDGARPERILMRGSGTPPYMPKEAWRISPEFFSTLRAEIQARSDWDEKLKVRIIPSTGLAAICWLLQHVPALDIVGFDSFSPADKTRAHHYFGTGSHVPKEHDGVVEAAMISELREAGRVTVLS